MPLYATWIGSSLCRTLWRQLLPLLRRPLLLRSLLRLFHVLLRSQFHHWWPPLAIVALPCRGVWRPRWDLFFSRSPEYHPETLFKLSSGVVSSPNHPGSYPNHLEQTQTIQVKQGMVLSLQFTVFDIEFFADSDYEEFQYDYDVACERDYLTIKDGDGTVLMERGCGSTEDVVTIGADMQKA